MSSITPYKRSSSRAVSSSKRRKVKSNRPNQRYRVQKTFQPLVIQKYPFPQRLQNVMRYVEEVQVSIDGSGFGYYVFRANGMYDPNATGTGHQPMYFDNMTAIYNHFHVIKSKCKVHCTRSSSVGDVNLAVYIDDDGSINATKYRTLAERPGSVTWTAYPGHGVSSSRTKYWNAQHTFGGNVIDNDNLRGTSAADPTEQSTYVIGIEAADSAAGTVNILVEIEYTTVWSELWSQAPS